ncbi:MAG TPA: hypothetical protein VIG48_06710 [Jatrophihabitans sp.]
MSNDYSSWDLKTLKLEIENADISWLDQSARQFDEGSRACAQAADDFMNQVKSLGAAWEGPAASAAVADAQTTHQQFTQMHSASTASSSASKSYYEQAKADQAKSRSIPNVDDSMGHAITSGAPGGIIGIGMAKYQQHQKYQQAHAQAVQIANRMDSGGTAQADTMRSQSWPNGPTRANTPPSSLPPVPGSGGRSGHIGSHYSGGPHGGGPGGGYSTPVAGVAMNSTDNQIMTDGVKGHDTRKPPQAIKDPTPPTQTTIPTTTTPQSTDPGTNPLTPAGPPSQAVPETPSGGVGTAGGVLGGAGLLGAGALTGGSLLGRGANGASEGFTEGTGRGRSGGLAEGESRPGTGTGSGSGLAEGESTGRGRLGSGALGEGEAGSSRLPGGGLAQEELPPGRRGVLRAGAPEGFMGEPVAGEAGRMGGYPGGGGARRRDDEEEARVPDYLVETEDVWGDGVTAAPPVIGE